jgi:hypothetical protein
MKHISLLTAFLFSATFLKAVCSVTAVTTPCTCYNACNGSATLTPSGGVAPYTYSWSPGGQTTATVTGLCAGSNTAYVIDAQGCVATIVVTITQPSQINLSVSAQPATSSSNCDGTGTSNVSGGTPPYAYVWSPASSETTPTASSLCSGPCNFCVTDDNGCTVCQLFQVGNSVGINEVTDGGAISVYPNPSSGKVTLEAAFEEPVAIEVMVTNIFGETVYAETRAKAADFNFSMDISQLAQGVYFVAVKTPSGISVRRIVKE